MMRSRPASRTRRVAVTSIIGSGEHSVDTSQLMGMIQFAFLSITTLDEQSVVTKQRMRAEQREVPNNKTSLTFFKLTLKLNRIKLSSSYG